MRERYRYVWDSLSGTGFIERLSDGFTTMRYVGWEAAEMRRWSEAKLREEAQHVEFTP